MKDCLFCKIVNKEIPAQVVYEDDKTLAFLDIAPVNEGHTLVIPKEHCTDITDISKEDAKAVSATVRKVAKAVLKGIEADGLTITMNNKPAAGQIIFHSHTHIIPRLKEDGLKLWPQHPYKEGQAEEFKNKIIKFL